MGEDPASQTEEAVKSPAQLREGPGKKTISLFADESILNKSMHAKLACVACHAGFNPDDLPHKATIEPVACQRCHAGAVFKHPFHGELAKARS